MYRIISLDDKHDVAGLFVKESELDRIPDDIHPSRKPSDKWRRVSQHHGATREDEKFVAVSFQHEDDRYMKNYVPSREILQSWVEENTTLEKNG